jgi:hypothetical protein
MKVEYSNEHFFGVCPICKSNDGYLNLRRENWFVCHAHRFKWLRGENLISTWRYETKADWVCNAKTLESYRQIY